MKYHRPWERLIEYIDEWASAGEVPGGIEVTFEQSPGVPRTVEVVVSSPDWDDYLSTVYGTGDPRATTLKKKVLAMPDEASYLVYDTYDWEPSGTRELPKDDFNPGPGEWVVTDDRENVVDRFADFDEQGTAAGSETDDGATSAPTALASGRCLFGDRSENSPYATAP